MSRSKKQVDRIVSHWPLIQKMKRSVKNPIMRRLLKSQFSETGLQASFIPVGETVEIPPSVIPTREVIMDFLNRASYRALATECVCRVGGKCKSFPIEVGTIFMGEGARDLHPTVGRSVSVEEAARHVDHALELGLVPMVGHLMVDSKLFRMKKFDRFLTMCFCCECCCNFLKNMKYIKGAWPNTILPVDGVSVEVCDMCEGCGTCVPVCPVEGISIVEDKAVMNDQCFGCGCCANACPNNAINLTISPDSKVLEELRSRVESRTRID